MKLFKRIKEATQKISKKALVITGTLLAIGALGAGYVQAEFYPDRPVFDYNKGSDTSNCADPNDPGYSGGRCGSLNGPVFNSFINTPSYGDERAFADARRTDQTAAGSYKNALTDVTSGSKEVIIRTYVHNNANQNDNTSGKAIAHDTKVKVLLPTADTNGMRARSYISASNAAMVEDTVDFTAPENFHMEYIPGSATLVNYNTFKNGTKLSDSIVTTGALIGSDSLNGDLKGCFDYASVVEIHVKIVPDTKTKVTFTKQVRKSGTTTWGESADVKPGETVQYLMTTTNTGTAQIDNSTVRDVLPPHVQLVAGTVKRIDASRNQVLQDTPLFDGGYDLGSYGVGSGFYVMFDAKALDNFTTCSVRDRNVAYVKTSKSAEQSDTADVVITKDNCNTPTPLVVCDTLTAPKLSLKTGESTVFTAAGHAVNTTISGYIFKVNGQVVQDSASSTYTFTQNAEGTYTVDVTVKSPAGNVTSDACAKTVHVQKEVTPVYTCDALTFSKSNLLSGEKFTTTVRYTAAGGATFKQAVYNFGDNATFTTNTSTNGVVTADHSYAAKGNYAVTVKLEFTVNGQTKSVEGGNCIGQVTVTNEKCVIPGKEQFEKNDKEHCNDVKGVTTIPDTGAGNMIGLFAAVTAAGAFLHSMWTRRAMNR